MILLDNADGGIVRRKRLLSRPLAIFDGPMHATINVSTWLAPTLAVLSLGAFSQTPAPPGGRGDLLVYFGTYTGAKSKGVYVSRLDVATGMLSAPELAAESASPSFLAVHPSRPLLYAVNEVNTFGGQKTGSVSAFVIEPGSGKLTALNQQSSGGTGPAHLTVDAAGTNVLVANYGGGSVAVLPIDATGALKPATAVIQHSGSSLDPQRQTGPHAHAIIVDSADRFAYVADLGLDKVLIYRYDAAKGSLTANVPPSASVNPGSGPRHLRIHPGGRFAYVINEMLCTITVFSRDPERGAMRELQTLSTLPPGQAVQSGYSTAELQLHPSGRFLYGSNRGHDSITVFAIDAKTGTLTFAGSESTQGSTPRGFGIDPSGRYLLAANQRSDSVIVFRIDGKTGRLTPTRQKIEVGSPVCVEFVKSRE
jgi:6-phosphogluconolactonase